MIELKDIPQGWAKTTLGKVISISSGKGLVKAQQVPNGKYTVYGGNGVTGSHNEYIFEDEQLIIGRVGVHCGNCHISKNKSWITDNAFVVNFNHKELTLKFLYYLLKVLNLNKYSSSTAQPVLSQGKLYPIVVYIPPLTDQEAIVSKLEELFSELDKGKEQLETARQQLKVYRQAVLKWAFEGRFTNPEVNEDELPVGWKWVKLGNLALVKRGKSKHRPRNDKRLFGGPYPFIQTGEVRAANGGIINSWSETYSEFGLEQSKIWPKGTLCLTIAANIAETAFLGFDACFPDSVVGIAVNDELLSLKYLNYFIQNVKREIDNKASATAQKNINVEFLDKLLIPTPSVIQQNQIVQEIESRLSVCDKLEETINQSLQQAETLRQSILKQAFEGKLVFNECNVHES